MNNILMVCVGNICRSPMAEGLLQHNAKKYHWPLQVHSAGIAAVVGGQASPHSITIMNNQGIDIAQHVPRQITLPILSEADLILVMERWQQQELGCIFPSVYGKVHRLGKWDDFDIPDPYRKSQQDFEDAYELIQRGLLSWQKKLWSIHV